MKIAFVGKGGSGKSTLSALFVRYLQLKGSADVLVVDADLNMNLAGLLGVDIDAESLLSRPEVAQEVRRHLRGKNTRIEDESKFLPTTPPAAGSNLIVSADDQALLHHTAPVAGRPLINLLTVGSYESEGIGQTCYHSHLFVAENILSHTVTNDRFTIVCDMVAGTDAFAYSMHLQFDAIVLIAEPTVESTEVCELYLNLARDCGIDSLVHIVGNKIADSDDLSYVRRRLSKEPLGCVDLLPELKKARQQGRPIEPEMITDRLQTIMRQIVLRAQSPAVNAGERMKMLHDLHLKLCDKKWVQLGYGDVSGQIDPGFELGSNGEQPFPISTRIYA